MRHFLRGIFVLAAACALLQARALAAPERLGDLVPDAVPDAEGAWDFAWGHEAISLDDPLDNEQAARDYFKLRFTFSPKVSASLRYTANDLVSGYGLVTPLFNNVDSSQSYTANIDMNLMNTPRVNADKANNIAFSAGSAFGIGLTGTQYMLKFNNVSELDDLDQQETLIAAYLIYSTDLTEEMRAHTYFSSGRLSGDTYTGSCNRVGAGLDYMLMPGKRPLELMVNGVLDIYNFRQPSFNTSRVSRFDFGLRYRVAQDWYTTIGWATVNDSESNKSGSGLFGGINYCQAPREKKPQAECPPPAAPDGSQPPAQPSASAPAEQTQLAQAEQPPLMASAQVPAAPAEEPAGSLGDQSAPQAPPEEKAAAAAPPEPDPAAASAAPDETASSQEIVPGDGIAIPEPPVDAPQPTPEGAVMLRAGIDAPPSGDLAPEKTVASAETASGAKPADAPQDSEQGVMEIAALSPADNPGDLEGEASAGDSSSSQPPRSKVRHGAHARKDWSRLKHDK